MINESLFGFCDGFWAALLHSSGFVLLVTIGYLPLQWGFGNAASLMSAVTIRFGGKNRRHWITETSVMHELHNYNNCNEEFSIKQQRCVTALQRGWVFCTVRSYNVCVATNTLQFQQLPLLVSFSCSEDTFGSLWVVAFWEVQLQWSQQVKCKTLEFWIKLIQTFCSLSCLEVFF